MPKSYLARLDTVKTPNTRQRTLVPDDTMTLEERKHYLEAKQDCESGVNITS